MVWGVFAGVIGSDLWMLLLFREFVRLKAKWGLQVVTSLIVFVLISV